MGYTLFPAATAVKNGFFEALSQAAQAWTVDWKPGVYEVIPNSLTATYTITLKTGGKNGTTVLTGTVANGGSTFTTSANIDYISILGTNAASVNTGIGVHYLTDMQTYIPGTGFVYRFTTNTTSTIEGSAYLLLVGGGSGGQNGSNDTGYSGFAGTGGSSGKVYSVGPVTLAGGESVVIGTGGNSNTVSAQAGNAGNATTFGAYSSASGTAANGGGGGNNNNGFRQGGTGAASGSTNAPTILSNTFLSAGWTTGGGGGGAWNYAIGGTGGPGGGSGIGTGGAGQASGGGSNPAYEFAASGTGYGSGGGGGGGAGNGNNYVNRGGAGAPGVAYVILA